MPAQYIYTVEVVYTGVPGLPYGDYSFGPFATNDAAEQCLIAVASRSDVKAAVIKKEEVV